MLYQRIDDSLSGFQLYFECPRTNARGTPFRSVFLVSKSILQRQEIGIDAAFHAPGCDGRILKRWFQEWLRQSIRHTADRLWSNQRRDAGPNRL
jgi:hypothetical protein